VRHQGGTDIAARSAGQDPDDLYREHSHRRKSMTTSSEPAAHRKPPPAAILVVPLVVALILTLFAWPSARLQPRDLPIGAAGAPPQIAAIEQRLARQAGAFDVERYPGEAAARAAIEDRDVYGAFVATAGGAKVLTASAASPAVAELLQRAAEEGPVGPLPVEDVVAAGPRGVALPSSVLPLLIAGILAGVLASTLAARAAARAALVAAGSILAGLVAALIVHSWLDVLRGSWLENAGALSLMIGASAAGVAGMNAMFGPKGIAFAALAIVLVGNPLSGVASAPELLPQPLGDMGQLLSAGAGGNLVRSTGFFDGAGAGGHIAVLAAWVLFGLALLAIASLRGRGGAPETAPSPAEPAVTA
jgi:hypothetical protein